MPECDGVDTGSDPAGGRDSTGKVMVTSPSLTEMGVGNGTGVAEPITVSNLAQSDQGPVVLRTCVARLLDADFIAN